MKCNEKENCKVEFGECERLHDMVEPLVEWFRENQRDLPGFDSFGVYDISEEDIQRVKDSLDSVSSKNKEVSIKVMLKVRGERQMCDLKLHTLWSSLKTDGYIGIVGQLDIVK